MDHHMEPQTIVDEDSQEDAVVNANIAELESSQYDEPHTATTPVKEANNDNIPQPPAPKRPRKNPTSTGTRKHPASSKRKFTTDDVVEEEDEQPSSLGKNT